MSYLAIISCKKTDREYYEYCERTSRYNEWTDERRASEWIHEYYEWTNSYYEWEKSTTSNQASNIVTQSIVP